MRSLEDEGFVQSIHVKLAFIILALLALAACDDRDLTAPAARARLAQAAAADSAPSDTALAIRPAREAFGVHRAGRDSVALRIVRPAGLADRVTLAVDSVPEGLTVAIAPATTADTTALLTVAATDSAPLGAHRVVLRASAGAHVATGEVTIVVRPPALPAGGPANAVWAFCDPAEAPVWLGYREEDGRWTRIAPETRGGSAVYRFVTRGRGAVAYVTRERGAEVGIPGLPTEDGWELSVFHGNAAELAAIGQSACGVPADSAPAARKRLNGSVAGVGMTGSAFVSMGSATAMVMGMQPTFTLENIAPGRQDLVAALSEFSLGGGVPSMSLSKLIIRRGLDLADGATIPTLDFAADEAFAPAAPKLAVDGAAGARVMASVTYETAGGGSGMLFSGLAGGRYFGVPAAKQAAGDRHMLMVMTVPPGGDDDEDGGFDFPDEGIRGLARQLAGPGAPGAGTRAVVSHFRVATDRRVALGPELAAPVVTTAAGAPWQARVARQAEYAAGLTVSFDQESARRRVVVTMTAGWAGDATTWEAAIPDLASAEGFEARWAPRADAATRWTASAFGGDFAATFAVVPEEGAQFRFATRSGGDAPIGRAAR